MNPVCDEIAIWWLIAQVRRVSAPYEQTAMANEALYRAYNNKN